VMPCQSRRTIWAGYLYITVSSSRRISTFGQIANGWNASGSGPSSHPWRCEGPGKSRRGRELQRYSDWSNSRSTPSARATPRRPLPMDAVHYGDRGWQELTDSVPTLATVATATKPDVASTYVPQAPTKPNRLQIDWTLRSRHSSEMCPSTSSTALGQTAGLLPGPASMQLRVTQTCSMLCSHLQILRLDAPAPTVQKPSSPTVGMENKGTGVSQLMRKRICTDGRTRRKLLSK
jgi:hypothetical protein